MGSGAEKRAGSEELRCVAGTAPALLQSGVRGHFLDNHKTIEFR